jgi:aryl-alcohol dehydrogenase-like predicted oxidoreductase
MTVTPDIIRANVDERCQRLRTDSIDLLQFHWQFVSLSLRYYISSFSTNSIHLVQ